MTRGASRRQAVKLVAAGLAAAALQGHTPYAQWTIYRKRNLFIVASRTDAEAVALAEAIADGLAAELPDSHARFTRATDPVRTASLLRTGQLEVAVIAWNEAEPMAAGTGPYESVGPVPLQLLAVLGRHLLVTVAAFKDRHAFLIAQALDPMSDRLGLVELAAAEAAPLPAHPGALAYRRGQAIPAAPAASNAEAHPHPH